MNFKELMLIAPEGHLDTWVKEKYIKHWSDSPTALQILETLDVCIWGSLASGLIINILTHHYYQALAAENKTHKELIPLAVWREEMTKTWTNQIK